MLNYGHELLEGLQGFWLPVHGRAGGSRLYDLSAYGRHGDFINGLDASDWTQSSSRQYPVLDFETPDERAVDLPYQAIMAQEEFSVGAWCKTPDVSEDPRFISAWNSPDGERWQMWMDTGGNGPSWATATAVSDTLYIAGTGSNNANADTWYWVSTTLDNDTLSIYVDGDLADSVSYSGTINTTSYFRIGQNSDNTNSKNNLEGKITAPIITHALSAPEQASLYDQARRGFPDLLRRRSDVGLLGGGGGGTTAIVVNSNFSGRAGTVGSDLAVKQALQSTLSGAVGTVGSDVAVRQALESTLSGAPGTLSATTRALPSITTDLQGNAGTFASGIASIAAVEAAMTGRPGSLTSQAAVLQALNAGLSGQAGTLDIQLSTSQLTSVNVNASGAKGSLSSTLAARLALESALQGASGTISAEVGIPLSLNADFAGARGDLVATLGDFRTLDATLEGRPGTLSVAAKVIQRLQAALQGAAGDSTAVARVTQAVSASLEGRPGQLTSILGDIGALATIDARLRDELQIDAILDDALSIDADLTD